MVSQAQRGARQSRTGGEHESKEKKVPLWTSLLAEVIGTFFLTFVSVLPISVAAATGHLHNIDKVVPAGMVVAAQIYALGPVSGAHFNPAVTLGFALRKAFPWHCVPLYWIAQLIGATAAGALNLALYGPIAHDGATLPNAGIWQSFVLEVAFTFLLMLIILSTSNQHRIVGPNAALAVGLVIALDGLIGGAASGASMNPARSLGPAIFGGTLDTVWIYILAPAAGAALAVGAMYLLHGPVNGDEPKQATGPESRISD